MLIFYHQGSSELNMVAKKDTSFLDDSIWAMPPRQSNEEFHEAYEVVLVLDDRENSGFV
jgi:crossover junction endonuclease MUS81